MNEILCRQLSFGFLPARTNLVTKENGGEEQG